MSFCKCLASKTGRLSAIMSSNPVALSAMGDISPPTPSIISRSARERAVRAAQKSMIAESGKSRCSNRAAIGGARGARNARA